MKTQTLLFLFLAAPFFARSQYSSGSSLALTVYANIFQENKEIEFLNLTNGETPEKTETVQSLRIGRFSPALSIFHPNGHLSEIELSFLTFDKQDFIRIAELSDPFPGTTQTFSLGIRYAFNFNLMARQRSTVQPHIGFSALPFVEMAKTDPEIKTLYNTTQTNLGVLGQVIPRLLFQLSDYVILDLNAPVTVLDARSQSIQLQGGGNSLSNIKKSQNQLRWLPSAVHIRVGLGVVF